MASLTGNMTPVYDGMGNLMGYVTNTPMQISKVVIENGTISMFDRNGLLMGSSQLEDTMLTKLGFIPSNGNQAIINGTNIPLLSSTSDIMTGGTMPTINTPTFLSTSTPETGLLGGDIFGGGDVPVLQDCINYSYSVDKSSIRIIETDETVFVDTSKTGDETVSKSNPPRSVKRCILVADVYECCWGADGRPTVRQNSMVATIVLARGKFAVTYEECYDNNGNKGVRANITQYFDRQDIESGNIEIFADYVNSSNDPRGNIRANNIFKRGFDNKNGYVNISGGEAIWGECSGQIGTGFLGNYVYNISSSVPLINNYVNFSQSYLGYPIRQLDGNPTYDGILLGGNCSVKGVCIVTDKKPKDPPKEEPVRICLTVNSIQMAEQIDSGNYSKDGYTLKTSTISSNGVQTSIANSLYYINGSSYPTLVSYYRNIMGREQRPDEVRRLDTEINLAEFGFPCEKGFIKEITPISVDTYDVLTICFYIDEKTGNLMYTGDISPNGKFYGSEIRGTVRREIDTDLPKTYDTNANCCSTLQWPQDYKGDTPLVNGGTTTLTTGGPITGGPTPPPGGFNGMITPSGRFNNATITSSGQVSVGGMPPPNISYLNYRLDTIKTVRITTCGCEEVTIADIWCYYNNEPIAMWAKADVNDPRTHISPIQTIPDINCIDTRVYYPFDRRKDIFTTYKKDKTRGLFNGSQSLDCYITSSVTSSTSNQYYYAVTDCENCGKQPYFAVSYGHVEGSGSEYLNGDDKFKKTPTDAIYSQYQLLCNDNEQPDNGTWTPSKFSFVSQSVNVESDDIYVINFYQKGLADKLDPGNFEIRLAELSGSFYANSVHTGSNVKVGGPIVMQFIDNSDDFSQAFTCHDQSNIRYALISGSLDNGKYEESTVNTYGWVYPSIGVIVLHPKRLNEILGFNTVTGSNISGDNSYKLFTSISGAASPTSGRSESYKMLARNVSYKTVNNYSVRIYGHQANYSTNPTFVTGSKNRIFDKCFIENPYTYITSVGLYNENLELLAVAKLTKPMKKSFDTDLLIKIRLNW
jgi:hypothetical protein